jgi:hypothetical protein
MSEPSPEPVPLPTGPGDRSSGPAYEPPVIVDCGALADVTRSSFIDHVAHAAQFGTGFALSVVAGGHMPGGQGETTVTPPTSHGGTSHEVTTLSGHAGSGGGSTGVSSGAPGTNGSASGTGGGGGTLPFTGYAVSLVAGAGLAMAAASRLVRRLARR